MANLLQPDAWMTIKIQELASMLSKPTGCITDALTWFEDNGYAALRIVDEKHVVKVKLMDTFTVPLQLKC
jgi:hypothetical protein